MLCAMFGALRHSLISVLEHKDDVSRVKITRFEKRYSAMSVHYVHTDTRRCTSDRGHLDRTERFTRGWRRGEGGERERGGERGGSIRRAFVCVCGREGGGMLLYIS